MAGACARSAVIGSLVNETDVVGTELIANQVCLWSSVRVVTDLAVATPLGVGRAGPIRDVEPMQVQPAYIHSILGVSPKVCFSAFDLAFNQVGIVTVKAKRVISSIKREMILQDKL